MSFVRQFDLPCAVCELRGDLDGDGAIVAVVPRPRDGAVLIAQELFPLTSASSFREAVSRWLLVQETRTLDRQTFDDCIDGLVVAFFPPTS